MKYVEHRSKITTGDLLAFSSGSWTSLHNAEVNIVRMLTRSEYSHVGVAWVVHNRVFILEAVGSGIRMYPLSKDLPCYWIPRNKTLKNKTLDEAFSLIGEKYSKLEAVKAFFNKVKIGENKVWECAEFVAHLYEVDGDGLNCLATPSSVVNSAIIKWEAPIYYLE